MGGLRGLDGERGLDRAGHVGAFGEGWFVAVP
jgi:hypothetical protein